MKKFTFLIPVYNDWENLKILLEKIDFQIKKMEYQFDVIILNDFSHSKQDISINHLQKIKQLKIINLIKNIGSQRAIAIGLKYISKINEDNDEKMIIIMDSDGQDDPEIINKIIEINDKFPNKVITINRSRRSEPLWFKILYEIHCYTLMLFTGHKIRFGNYSLIGLDKINKILSTGDLWAAYSAAISKSCNGIYKFFHARKLRYSGIAKMNLFQLGVHSLRIFSVFKYRILISSIIYSVIFFFLGSSFYFFIYLLIILNILTFAISINNKKKFDSNCDTIISNIDTLK